jgi:nicotinate phosphoribosyltransferase
MIVDTPIISSLLDNDLYTFTVGQVAFKLFPSLEVEYQFINRGHTPFPDDFSDELKHQLHLMEGLQLNYSELTWLRSLGYIQNDYIDWLSYFRFDPSELTINQVGGELSIKIRGSWIRAIMWEVPLLALISELYYRLTNREANGLWVDRIVQKARNLNWGGCKWIDFGTRRRFSFRTQNEVVNTMKNYSGFLGTSNMFLAMKHNVSPNGTMSHQGPMAMMGKYGVVDANKEWMNCWKSCYGNKLLIYLVDTFTTDVFFRDFNTDEATLWNGLRQDSGKPDEWMEKVLSHYNRLGIPTKNKTFIFSDNLTDEKYKALSLKYREYATIIGGIGTFLSNDCGHKPLNMVIKLSGVKVGGKWKGAVKLSDDAGKYTGMPKDIERVKKTLKLA